jgi:hypothetical protein
MYVKTVAGIFALFGFLSACADTPSETLRHAAGVGPLRVLSTNPRYFTDGTGKAVYLTGSHTWKNFQSTATVSPPPTFDFEGYLDMLKRYHHNFVRLWTIEQARWAPSSAMKDYYVDISAFKRSGPGIALDGKPKFDVDHFDETYFARLRSRVEACAKRGVYVSIMLFNGWSVEPLEEFDLKGNPWQGHPFHRDNNINGIDGDINGDEQGFEIHTLSHDPRLLAVRSRQEAYVRKVIDSVNDFDNVMYEIGNELALGSTAWQYHMIRYIKEYEGSKPKQHPVGMTAQGTQGSGTSSNQVLFDSPADWISPGNFESEGATIDERYQQDPPEGDGKKVIITDTDHLWGIGGDGAWVWKSFLRGLNPVYMDPYDNSNHPPPSESARRAMGDTLRFAERVNLAQVTPHSHLSSSTYCMAKPGVTYLVWAQERSQDTHQSATPTQHQSSITINLSDTTSLFRIEWFSPTTGEIVAGDRVIGGGRRTFRAPFSGDAVLYLEVERG